MTQQVNNTAVTAPMIDSFLLVETDFWYNPNLHRHASNLQGPVAWQQANTRHDTESQTNTPSVMQCHSPPSSTAASAPSFGGGLDSLEGGGGGRTSGRNSGDYNLAAPAAKSEYNAPAASYEGLIAQVVNVLLDAYT